MRKQNEENKKTPSILGKNNNQIMLQNEASFNL